MIAVAGGAGWEWGLALVLVCVFILAVGAAMERDLREHEQEHREWWRGTSEREWWREHERERRAPYDHGNRPEL